MPRLFFTGVFWITFSSIAQATGWLPLEMPISRAGSISLVRVAMVDSHSLTFRCLEQLRGKTHTEITFAVPDFYYKELPVDSRFLLYSQGDIQAEVSPPFLYLGFLMGRNHCDSGWMVLPITEVKGEIYVKGANTLIDGHISTDGAPEDKTGLSLLHIKQLLKRFPYDPHAED